MWDVTETFGEVHGEAATYLTPETTFGPTLALRAGGKKVWGRFPFFESAFIGGAATVRGLREQRYAGDAALYGNAELRVRLGRFFVALPGDFGVFGLARTSAAYISRTSPPTPGTPASAAESGSLFSSPPIRSASRWPAVTIAPRSTCAPGSPIDPDSAVSTSGASAIWHTVTCFTVG